MADFHIALALLLRQEGGYVSSTSGDPGGETYCGISRRFWPNWDGWEEIDKISDKKADEVFPSLQAEVATFYFDQFWTLWMHNHPSQRLVNFRLSMSVNEGAKDADHIAVSWNAPLEIIGANFLEHYRTRPDADKYFDGWAKRVCECLLS